MFVVVVVWSGVVGVDVNCVVVWIVGFWYLGVVVC